MRLRPSAEKFKQNIPFILSSAALAVLCLFPSGKLWAALAALPAVCLLACFFSFDRRSIRENGNPMTLCCAGALCLLLAARFVLKTESGLSLPVLAAAALAGALLSLYCVLSLICLCYARLAYPEGDAAAGMEKDRRALAVSFITALVVVGICSKSSPIYPFNDWGDANCFVTVGKSMLHGLVPYRDLYEQKGPLLYMLHALGALFSETSFIGIFLIEVLAGTGFLLLCHKTLKLYDPGSSLLWLPVIAAVVCGARSFYQGDSAEELCLPFYAYGIYCGLKAVLKGSFPSDRECFIVGLTSACVLWIKFSLLGFYIGWFLCFAILAFSRRRAGALLRMLGFILAGVGLASLPILAYFLWNDALPDLWQVYFYDNLFLYSRVQASAGTGFGLILNLCHGLSNFVSTNGLVFCFMLLGGMILVKCRRWGELLFIGLSFLFSFILVFVGGRFFIYYSLIFSAFVVIGIPPLARLTKPLAQSRRARAIAGCAVPVLCVLLAFLRCENTYLLRYGKADLPQFQFAEIIHETEDASLLNYGFLDGGFYTAAGIVPNCRFFSNLNIPLPDIMETQRDFVKKGKVDFVVTSGQELEAGAGPYRCVAESAVYYEGSIQTYYLYQLDTTSAVP